MGRQYKNAVREDMACPVCKGKGRIKSPQRKMGETEIKERAVIILRKAGFSFREIMTFVGYKSPHSISKILYDKARTV